MKSYADLKTLKSPSFLDKEDTLNDVNMKGLLEAVCAPVVAASGTCRYEIADGDFNTAGFYNFEIELTKVGAEESTQVYELEVTESG